MRHWQRMGQIFNLHDPSYNGQYLTHAQSPQGIILDDRIRVTFSTRQKDTDSDKVCSHIASVDFTHDFKEIIDRSKNEIIPLGALGCFDEHGIFPISPLQDGDELWAFTCGWSRRVSVSVETATGLCKSKDNGKTFKRIGDGPVFASSLHEPMLVGDSFVRKYNGQYHMWYMYGTKWVQENEAAAPDRVYKIGHAISDNLIDWAPDYQSCIEDRLHENECLALPSVIEHNGYYHMVFCYRDVFGFRTDPARAYRIGYAYSFDLKHWVRDDSALADIDEGSQEWDKDMKCYPHLLRSGDTIYLLYNGNHFGRNGFGAAKLDESTGVILRFNSADAQQISDHFQSCDPDFLEHLTSRIDLDEYIEKLLDKAERYELWENDKLVGFLAVYHNSNEGFDFVSNISIVRDHQGRGLGYRLLDILRSFSKKRGSKDIKLEVHTQNRTALTFYQKLGFMAYENTENHVKMRLTL